MDADSPENHFLLLTSSLSNLVPDQFHYNMGKVRSIKKAIFTTGTQTIIDVTHPGGGGSPWLTVFGGEWRSPAGGVWEASCPSAAET